MLLERKKNKPALLFTQVSTPQGYQVFRCVGRFLENYVIYKVLKGF